MAFIPMLVENFLTPNHPQPGSSRSEYSHRGVATDLSEDIRNAIAIAQAMFGPENQTSTRSTHQQLSELSVMVNKDKFQANFDVQHFKPEEITVKLSGDNTVTIEAKHEEKQDEHGQIYRHFIRKYVLPENCDIGGLESKLSSDGILTIMAPIGTQTATRTIPIVRTGHPATLIKSTEQKEPEVNSEGQSMIAKPVEQKKPEENPDQSVN